MAWTEVTKAHAVTDEISQMACDIIEGWYNDGPIDWEGVWDRMDGSTLSDGTRLDLGGKVNSPAMNKIKRIVQRIRETS